MNKNLIKISIGAVIFLFVMLPHSPWLLDAQAEENMFGLDARGNVDIYLQSYDELVVIRNVEIIDFREVHDKIFLVIQTDHFEGKRSEGLILYDYVRAILPSHRTTLMPGTKKIIY